MCEFRSQTNVFAYQCVALFPSELLAQELDDSLEAVTCCDLVEVLLHDWCIPHCLEPDNNCSNQIKGYVSMSLMLARGTARSRTL